MKILTRKEFIKMPCGTLFSYYEPCIFTGLYIKDDDPREWIPDFLVSDLIGAIEHNSSEDFGAKCERMEKGESMKVDFEFTGREGLFDDKQLFAVYEKEDVEILIKRLQQTLI